MKKTLLSLLVVAMLALSVVAMPASAADDFVVFADGAFQNGGAPLDASGTIIQDGNLIGGEELFEGEVGSGWFQITLDDSEGDANWKAHKYIKITCRATKMGDDTRTGAYGIPSDDGFGGTVKGVDLETGKKPTHYQFKDIEANGNAMATNTEEFGTYYLDTTKFLLDATWFTLTHCAAGYVVSEIVLTDNLGDAGEAPADPTTEAPKGDEPTTEAPKGDAPATTTKAPVATKAPSATTPNTGVESIGLALAVAGLAAAGLVIASKKAK